MLELTTTGDTGRYGYFNIVDARWSEATTRSCTANKRIYCLED